MYTYVYVSLMGLLHDEFGVQVRTAMYESAYWHLLLKGARHQKVLAFSPAVAALGD